MRFIMRIIFGCLLTVVVALNGSFRLTNIVLGTEPDQPSTNLEKNEGFVKEVTNIDSATVLSDSVEINAQFLEETEKQELVFPSQSIVSDPSFIDSIEVSSELSSTAETVVISSADTAAELKNRVKTQFTENEKVNSSSQIFSSFESEKNEYVVRAEPKMQVETIFKEVNESEFASTSSQEEFKKTAPQHEDIPSFSEWTQKQLAEAEKKKTDQNETTDRFTKTRGKFRNKNYASPDCGAKIVAANPESVSSSSVLSSLKDEYMLNYCTNRIWFVVELCEAIQAKQLDLANFELFSSSPKHFSVFLSHRFPTRDWSNVGKFTAQDSRDIQTFSLHPHLFGKYVKVELHSHYGREQFCPISWVGVYGTSEYEVLAKEDERHLLSDDDESDQYDEDIYLGHRKDSPKNLFSSATDAVLSIVKKATAPFMKTDNNDTESQNKEQSMDSMYTYCVTPRYIIVCNNCSQDFYDEVFNLLSCQPSVLTRLIANSFVKRTLINTESCTKYGLDFGSLRTGAPFPINFFKNVNGKQEVNYLTVMLKNSIVAALCNVVAIIENKVVVNTTVEIDQTLKNVTEKDEFCDEVNPSKPQPPTIVGSSSECRNDCMQSTSSSFQYTQSSIFSEIFKPSEQFSQKIEPTKTLTEDEVKMLPPSSYSEPSSKVAEEKSTELPDSRHVTSTATPTLSRPRSEVESSTKREPKITFVESKTEGEKEIPSEDKSNNATNQYSALESIISDLNAIEKGANPPSSSNTPSASNLPAESIFLRLANRIKTLEINMSLSSTYLEELSKRYRTQLELLSKTLNLTIQKMEERLRMEEEKERKKEKEILMLRMQLANLTQDVSILVREKNSWRPRASSISQHIFFISIEVLLVWIVFNYWKRSTSNKNYQERYEPAKKPQKKFKRRSSLEGVKGHETPRRKTRRPSDAVEIALARCHGDGLKLDKKRKRKKKDSKCSMNVYQLKRKRSDSSMPEVMVVVEQPTEKAAPPEEFPQPVVIPNNMLPAPEVEVSNRFAPISSPAVSPEPTNVVAKAFQGFSSSPLFMKTALAARNTRLRLTSEKESSHESSVSLDSQKKERKGSHGIKKYMKKFF